MSDIYQVLNLRNPQWVDSSHTAINCEVEFKKFEGTYIPFTANPNDLEAHGRNIHQRLVNGEWGSIATEPTE